MDREEELAYYSENPYKGFQIFTTPSFKEEIPSYDANLRDLGGHSIFFENSYVDFGKVGREAPIKLCTDNVRVLNTLARRVTLLAKDQWLDQRLGMPRMSNLTM
jgi:hypothetical protein